jgi:hypothetical protein
VKFGCGAKGTDEQEAKQKSRNEERALLDIRRAQNLYAAARTNPGYQIDDQVPFTATERLSSRVINTLRIENRAFSLRVLGEFTWHIPQLVGHGHALDKVASCLLAVHENLLRGGDPSCRINPQLYSHALHSLQLALNDPEEWCSLSTLCATVLMHRLEVSLNIFTG